MIKKGRKFETTNDTTLNYIWAKEHKKAWFCSKLQINNFLCILINISGSEAGGDRPSGSFIPPSEASADPNAPHMVIWGTDVSVTVYKAKFRKFLEEFIDSEAGEDEKTDDFDPEKPLYVQILEQINDLEEPFMNVNAGHVKAFDEDLYRQLICYPQEVIPTMDMAVNEMFFEKYPDTVLNHQVQVRQFRNTIFYF